MGPPAELMQRLVTPYRINLDIPQALAPASVYLFSAFAGDALRPRVCRFRWADRILTERLSWAPITDQRLDELRQRARDEATGRLGLRQVDGVWFVSLPSFDFDETEAREMRALLLSLRQSSPALHAAPWVVFDLRGNSGWGSDAARSLYGDRWVDWIEGQFDWTVDWRVSADNAASLRAAAAHSKRTGQPGDARYREALASTIEEAARTDQVYYRSEKRAKTAGTPPPAGSPFKGQVFLLTDGNCASACLDFVDVLRRLPGVLHIGQPTSADSVYIDNTSVVLPSGRSKLIYSMKVYRNRVRGNNEWYEPEIRWPGGRLTEDTIARWVKSLDVSKAAVTSSRSK